MFRSTRFHTAALLACWAVASCGDSGGSSTLSGEPPGTGVGGVSFALRRDVAIGPGVISDVLWADFNGDGLTDLIQSHFQPRRITLSAGRADGTFALLHEFPTRGGAWRLALHDVDGSGRLDVVVCELDLQGAVESGVEVWFQGLAGGFDESAFLPLPFQPLDLAVAPASGRVDGGGPAAIWLADRDGKRVVRVRFEAGPSLALDGEVSSTVGGSPGRPVGLAILDRRGDGWWDLVVAETLGAGGASDRVVVFEGSDQGIGPDELVLASLFAPQVRPAGDMDADGFDDLAITQFRSERVFLVPGAPTGFRQAITLDMGGETSSLLVQDLNQDGLVDVAATLFERGAVSLRLATGANQWAPPTFMSVGFQPRGLGSAHLGLLPWPALLCGNAMDVSILEPLDPGHFRSAEGFTTLSEGPITVRTADFDQDGDLDAVSMTAKQTSIVFFEGDGAGRLEAKSLIPLVTGADENYGHLVTADVDGDGLIDVMATVLQADELRFYRNTGTVGGFQAAPAAARFPTGSRPTGLELADLDGDGLLDAMVGNAGDLDVQTLFGTPTGFASRAALPPIQLGARPADLRSADFDGDGDFDLVLTTGGEGTPERLYIFAGDGSGALQLAQIYDLDTLSGSIEFGDLDEDGLLDLVVGQPGVRQDEFFVFFNRGGLRFDVQRVSAGVDPEVILVEDLDFDGHLDLLVVSGLNDLGLILGSGSRALTSAVPLGDFGLPFLTQEAVLADLDGDGMSELICASSSYPFLWRAANRSFMGRR